MLTLARFRRFGQFPGGVSYDQLPWWTVRVMEAALEGEERAQSEQAEIAKQRADTMEARRPKGQMR